MTEERKTAKMPHTVILENRASLTVTGVSNVDSFDEQVVVAYTDYGELVIRGNGLKINKLSVETGDLTLDGEVVSLSYTEVRPNGSVFSRIFR